VRIVVTALLDQLYELLRQGPHLVTLYDQKDIAFVPSLKSWLEECESVLEKYHRPQVSEIAGIRGQLLSASHGVFDKSVIQFSGKGNDRKTIQAGAAILFNKAQKTLSDIYQSFSANREEATKYMRQIIIIALQKDSFYPIWNGVAQGPEKLNILWQAFSVDPDLVQGIRQILTSVHYLDGLRIMDEVITELNL
jgi:hypothetical protein